jgi:hypothetical protein
MVPARSSSEKTMSRSLILRLSIAAAVLTVASLAFAQDPEKSKTVTPEQLKVYFGTGVIIVDAPEPEPAGPAHRDIPLPELDPAKLAQRWQDVEARLKARTDLQKLTQEILKNPKLLENNPEQRAKLEEMIKQSGIKLDPNDPLIREVTKWLRQHRTQPGGKRLTKETEAELQKLLEVIKKIEPSTSTPPTPTTSTPQPSDNPTSSSSTTGPTPARPALSPEEQQARIRFARWLVEQSQRLDRGRFQDSDLMREIRNDLQHYAMKDSPRMGGRWLDNDELHRRLQHLSRDVQSARIWSKINVPMPRINLPARSMPTLPSIGSWGRPPTIGGVPRFGAPSFPTKAPSGDVLLSVVGFVIVALVAWRLMVMFGIGRRRGEADIDPRKWTVVPDHVRTREDLIRAFEYLSLSKLGIAVRSWNHRRIAADLGGKSDERRQAAVELSSLYERARYAPEALALNPAEIQSARRALTLLCGSVA